YLLASSSIARSSLSNFSSGASNNVCNCPALVALTIGAVIDGFANNHANATVACFVACFSATLSSAFKTAFPLSSKYFLTLPPLIVLWKSSSALYFPVRNPAANDQYGKTLRLYCPTKVA